MATFQGRRGGFPELRTAPNEGICLKSEEGLLSDLRTVP